MHQTHFDLWEQEVALIDQYERAARRSRRMRILAVVLALVVVTDVVLVWLP